MNLFLILHFLLYVNKFQLKFQFIVYIWNKINVIEWHNYYKKSKFYYYSLSLNSFYNAHKLSWWNWFHVFMNYIELSINIIYISNILFKWFLLLCWLLTFACFINWFYIFTVTIVKSEETIMKSLFILSWRIKSFFWLNF